jgi:predicted NAD-dependent protein-ADP-ribosyltransferase YbiA (DUF1768 family)
MKKTFLFALALVWGSGALGQKTANETEPREKTEKSTAVPSTIDFQGRLHDSGGNPVNATLNITFSLYDVLSGGTAMWTETKSVQIVDGLFQVKLGETNPVDPGHFSDPDRWLGIKVGAEAEMSPRTKISSVGYAMQSEGASNIWTISENDIYYDAGKVGIGTSSPEAGLHALGNIAGVFGIATSTSGLNRGLWGRTNSHDGYAGFFEGRVFVSGSTDEGYDLMYLSNSGSGRTILAEAQSNTAIWGKTVLGFAGVDGRSNSNFGIHGLSETGTGVFGTATATSGLNRGIWGHTNSPDGYAGFFEGRVFVSGFTGEGYDLMYLLNSGSGRAILAEAQSNTAIWGKTVSGFAGVDGRSNSNFGIHGLSETGTGVFGTATAASGLNRGIWGHTNSPDGYAGYFEGRVFVSGPTEELHDLLYLSNNGAGRAILAEAQSNTAIWGKTVSGFAGVDGRSNSNFGIHGLSETGTGVFGTATAASGLNRGIWGHTNSPDGYAGYFEGRVFVSGSTGEGYDLLYLSNSGSGRAILAEAQSNTAIWGVTNTGFAGVDGKSNTGIGVYGRSESNVGVRGDVVSPTGFSGYFEGGNFYVSGKTGIGVTNPTQKLDIDGQIRIRGGSPGAGKVLTSDANGVGTWTPPGIELPFSGSTSVGTFGISISHTAASGSSYGGYFQSISNSGIGIMSEAAAASGTTYGGIFVSASTTGYGVLGQSPKFGIYGKSTGYQGRATSGEATGTNSIGVRGVALNDNSTGVWGEGSNYDFYANGPGVDYGTGSSIRWKRNIIAIPDPLAKIASLRGVYFDWDQEHGGKHDIGMIAEEVGKVLPEIVIYEENGIDAMGMDYSKIGPLLVEAVKALITENDRLKQDNLEVNARLERLERALEGMTQK